MLNDTGFSSGSDKESASSVWDPFMFNSWIWKIPWRRKWQPSPVFLPGESYGQRSGWATAHGSLRIRHDWATSTFLSTKWHTHGAMRVTRPTIKGQKVGGVPIPRNPRPFSKIVRLFLPLLSLWNYPAPQINHPIFGAYLLSSEISHILSMECASNTYTLLSCSWILPCRKLRTLTWWPIPGTHQRSGVWPSNHTFIFLHQRFWVPSPHRLW